MNLRIKNGILRRLIYISVFIPSAILLSLITIVFAHIPYYILTGDYLSEKVDEFLNEVNEIFDEP